MPPLTVAANGVKVVLGTAVFGPPSSGAKITTSSEIKSVLDTFASLGGRELDSARSYPSEPLLHEYDAPGQFQIATKAWSKPGYATMDKLRESLEISLKTLQVDKVDLFYLHAPDYKTPWAETARAMGTLQKEGKCARWGVSNFSAESIDEMVAACQAANLPPPSVYQGLYNLIGRDAERELFACLRKHAIKFYAFNVALSGMLGSKGEHIGQGTRGEEIYRANYKSTLTSRAVEKLVQLAEDKLDIAPRELAYRWMAHHSQLGDGDAVIIGPYSGEHLVECVSELRKGPLPDDAVKQIDAIWDEMKSETPKYYYDEARMSRF